MELEFNGKPYKETDFKEWLASAMKKDVARVMRERILAIKCPVHSRAAESIDINEGMVNISGICCEKLRAEIDAVLLGQAPCKTESQEEAGNSSREVP